MSTERIRVYCPRCTVWAKAQPAILKRVVSCPRCHARVRFRRASSEAPTERELIAAV